MKTNKEIYNEFMTKDYLGVRVTTEDRIIHAMEECTKEKDAEIERLKEECNRIKLSVGARFGQRGI